MLPEPTNSYACIAFSDSDLARPFVRVREQVKELCYSALTDASVGSHFLSPSAYAGSNVHPMELVFYKTEYGERRVLDALTTMTLQHSRIGIPLAFCFR